MFLDRIAVGALHQLMAVIGISTTRQHHPTESALIQLVDDVTIAFDHLIGRDIHAADGIVGEDVGARIVEHQLGVAVLVEERR